MAERINISPAEIEKTLKGIDFPATKDEIMQYARSQGVDEDVMEILDGMPDREYTRATDITQELSRAMEEEDE